ncbi:hypothetical protein CDD82_2177 [Ophiocordyceps australis]|uniref:VWFA domain-containing protein n=1 Tax=Ophiocordyceps australis TaxID=1399860 RepID=A0A2C5XVR3_9HYPO|nr:hypothetical protein CDD82_2177 [Ophiocordyceps australis]
MKRFISRLKNQSPLQKQPGTMSRQVGAPWQPGAALDNGPPPPPYAAPETNQYSRSNMRAHEADPFYFLYLFDTVLLIDDSSSMLGRRWREVQAALRQLAPVCTSHDDDGIDLYFMNHCSDGPGAPMGCAATRPPGGKAPWGYYNVTDASTIETIFNSLRPCGPTPTHDRLRHIIDPYMAQLRAAPSPLDVRPLNIIVLTDGRPGPELPNGVNPQDPLPLIVHYAHALDSMGAPLYQLGIQFIQVGDDAGATAALEALDKLRGGFRDIVDTTKYDGGDGPLTADGILKAVLGGVDKRLDDDAG